IFFFQAEDGIRYFHVTGVQTCALPIFAVALILGIGSAWYMIEHGSLLTTARIGPWKSWLSEGNPNADPYTRAHLARSGRLPLTRSEERRVGKEWKSRVSPIDLK